ncbi:MAG TPA: Tad domain-containing protein [Anaerolineales bacterium]|nr:Tad domain-containing protein [Anaerolineales bacterium]
MKMNHSERGQALIVIALAFVALVGIAGLVVDGGRAFSDRQRAQNAVDAAALASAYARINGGSVVDAAMASAAQNGYDNDGKRNIISLYTPPERGPHAGDIEYIEVIIRSTVPTYFLRVVGKHEIVNEVRATARTVTPEIGPLLKGHAVISLAPSSNCFNRLSFWIHGEATLDISGGGVFVNSNNQDCALVQQGSGSIRIEEGYGINVVGNASVQKLDLFTPAITPGAQPVPYPPPFFMPDVRCSGDAEVSPDGTLMSPGKWGEKFPPPGVTNLESGTYCLSDGMHITGSLEGHNVTFIVTNGEVRFSAGADIKLDARDGGDNAGLLLYVPMENQHRVVLNGGAGSNIQGTILAPASRVLIKGMDSKTGFHSQIIGYTVEVDGTSNVVIKFRPEQNFQTLTMPEIQLSQ